jgi:hypothetical protein
MIKKIVAGSILIVVMTLISLVIITQRNLDKEELIRVESELVVLNKQKSDLADLVKSLDKKQLIMEESIEEKNNQISRNISKIDSLEKERLDKSWKIRELRNEDDLEKSFSVAFPQVTDANNFGIVQIPIEEGSSIVLPYYVIPAWFAETFIIEHNNMLAYEKEIERFNDNEALYGNVIELKESVIQLQSEKSLAYQDGYEKAFVKYEQLNQDYIKLLKTPPKVEIKAPSLWPTLGGTLLGLSLGMIF